MFQVRRILIQHPCSTSHPEDLSYAPPSINHLTRKEQATSFLFVRVGGGSDAGIRLERVTHITRAERSFDLNDVLELQVLQQILDHTELETDCAGKILAEKVLAGREDLQGELLDNGGSKTGLVSRIRANLRIAFNGVRSSSRPNGANVPILVITADGSNAAKQKALAIGAKAFLTKPIDSAEALLRVYNLLETRWLRYQRKTTNEQLTGKIRAAESRQSLPGRSLKLFALVMG